MKPNLLLPLLKPLTLFIFLSSLSFLAFLSLHQTLIPKSTPNPNPIKPENLPPDLKIRPGYTTYDAYLTRQLNKTLNPTLRKIWTTRDWARKVHVFSLFFHDLKRRRLLSNSSKSLCIGARVGVSDSIGIDLVPYPPLVIEGDFHNQPFQNDSFSNVFDHALYPRRFVAEIERTLKPGGVCVLHVLVKRRADKYSANDLFSVKPLVEMFEGSEVVEVRGIDGFGLDTEIVFRKKKN